MPVGPNAIEYASPVRVPRCPHPLKWWFVADGVLFLTGVVTCLSAYHDLPAGQTPPPAVDVVITASLAVSLGTFPILFVWLVVHLVRFGRID